MNSLQLTKDIRSAIKKSDINKVVELIGSNAELLNMNTPFGSWLHVAASRGELAIVKKLIELGANVNMLGGVYGGGALNEAASAGHYDTVSYLLSCGADMDVSEPERNPLFGAISNGHADIAKLLIESGIDIHVKYTGKSMREMDALAFAKENDRKEIIELLENQNRLSKTARNNNNVEYHHSEILKHITNFFGPVKNTLNEIVPGSRVSISIHIIPPSEDKNFITLVTTGMSDEPMDFSNEEKVLKYAELLFKLPSSWIIEKDKMKDQEYYWPLGWLRKIAHVPHLYDGWIEEGVILPNGEPPQPFAQNTKLSSIMVCRTQETSLENVHTNKGNVQIYTLVPIFEEERNFALEKGHQHLINRMSEKGITDILDLNRINVCKEY
ncbi:suppressor of fused domain protein [Metabacillus halosaccharovorans]|uniref:suppressor of fused domain protein n=1 Tax=Metabacillus halosaccharovorans TaxID=930124 RepID=UPI001C200427|nr:suppressor of fused domain protein [Metabacillus halosaccharovorans]MBU7592616.1 hypothetical protein [Metabacillus halosaccharovorans]